MAGDVGPEDIAAGLRSAGGEGSLWRTSPSRGPRAPGIRISETRIVRWARPNASSNSRSRASSRRTRRDAAAQRRCSARVMRGAIRPPTTSTPPMSRPKRAIPLQPLGNADQRKNRPRQPKVTSAVSRIQLSEKKSRPSRRAQPGCSSSGTQPRGSAARSSPGVRARPRARSSAARSTRSPTGTRGMLEASMRGKLSESAESVPGCGAALARTLSEGEPALACSSGLPRFLAQGEPRSP
jgi:hypothetical protein